jgi:4-amino-4-deoxy-L-arabinose transferase-like glycosyltransferase
MPMTLRSRSRTADHGLLALLISLVTLTTFTALFVLRFLDDNRLTSWRWAFDRSDIRLLVAVLAAGIALAYTVSRLTVPRDAQKVAIFAAAFAAVVPFWAAPEVIVDTARYFMQAKYLELYGVGFFAREWGGEIAAWTDLPLVPFLHGIVFDLVGESRTAIQVFTGLLFAATVVLTWQIGATLWDDTVGGSAAALLLAMPYLLTQPALMLVDVPTMFFLTLAVFATLKAVREGGAGALIAAPVAITLAMLSKYSTWIMLSTLAVIVLVHLERGRRGRAVLSRAFIIGLATILLAGMFVLLKLDVVAAQVRLLWSYQLPGLARWEESHISTFLFQIHPFVTAAALCSVAVALIRRDRNYLIIAWMLMLLAVLGVKRARYILITLPMFALMAGYAMREVADGRIRRFIIGCAVASSLVTAVLGYLPLLKRMSAANLMAAGEHLDTLDTDVVVVFALPQSRSIINPAVSAPILDLFTDKRIIYRETKSPPPAPETIASSPLRFTWEYATPSFLKPGLDDTGAVAVAVIASHPGQPLPVHVGATIAGLQLSEEFGTSDEIFRFKTLVKVYYTP